MLVPNTWTTMSTGLGLADEEKLNVWLQALFEIHIEAGISVEPQVFPDTESVYTTV